MWAISLARSAGYAVADEAFNKAVGCLRNQVTAADTTIPYSEPLEAHVLPSEAQIVAAVRRVLK